MKNRILKIAMMSCVLSTSAFAEVVEVSPYNWAENVINAPPQTTGGHQILHFGSADYPYEDSPEGVEFVKKYLQKAKPFTSDAELLRFASDQVTLKGAYIELGVTTGKTTNFIAALNPNQTLYGFDSFMGNPEEQAVDNEIVPKGTFGLKDPSKTPPVLGNVKLIKGLFSESLPYFVKKYLKDQPIAFLHIDSDLYSSANDAFKLLGSNIKPGTIIVFDELYAFRGYDQGEFKALQEFLKRSGYSADYIAYDRMFKAVAIRIR